MSGMTMSADERKLQPVFDDINAGRYKVAESSIARHLKKTPKSQTALVARFVLLHEQAAPSSSRIQALNALRKMGELSPGNFWRTERALKEMKRWDLVMVINREATDRHPESEQHIAQLHLCAVACWDTEVMATTARKLFNSTKDVAWARRAAWAEWAKNAPQPTRAQPIPEPAPEGSLKIASLLLSTTRRPGLDAAPTSDVLWLHMQILLSARENRKAHELLLQSGKGGGLARDWYRMQGIQEIGKREEGDVVWVWEEELGEFLDAWRKDHLARRNYAYYRHSIVAARALLFAHPEKVERLRNAFVELDAEVGEKERAPKLARLELDLELAKRSSDLAMPEEEWEREMMAYWTRWGSKGSVVTELEGVVGERQEWLNGVMERRIPEGHSDERGYREVVNAHIYLLRNRPRHWQAGEDDIMTLWRLYIDGLAYGKNLTEKDVQPADQIGLAAVQLILYTPTDEAIHRAIICLEYILHNSPACAHAAFLLVRLYRLIGASSLATDRLGKLGLSEIQLDTLMHVWLEGAAADAAVSDDANPLADRAAPMYRMYNSSAVHLPENLRQAITQESYSKVHSIRALHQAQLTSRTRACLHLELCRAGGVINEEEAARLAKLDAVDLVDTRDWELMPSIGGNRPALQGLDHLKISDDSAHSMLSKIRMERAYRHFSRGEDVHPAEINLEKVDLSETDRAYYTALQHTVDRASGKTERPLTDVFEGLLAPSILGSRISARAKVACIRQALDHCTLISKAVDAKQQENGKRKSKSPVSAELEQVIAKLAEGLKASTSKLQRAEEERGPVGWAGLMGGLIEDTDFLDRRSSAIVEAKRNALRSLR